MIDAFIAGVLGGLAAPHLGGLFARTSYFKAVLYGVALGGGVWLVMFFAAWVLEGITFVHVYVERVEEEGWSDILLATFSMPLFFAVMFFLLRLLGFKATWEQAQLGFELEGYRRMDSEDGRVVTFERGRDKFIARVPADHDPTELEWFSFGERKGQVYLVGKWMQKRKPGV